MRATVTLDSSLERLLKAVLKDTVRPMPRPRHARKPRPRPRPSGGTCGADSRRLHGLADEVKVHMEVLWRLRQSR